jgi:ABC-2 type transport system permease protein
MKYVFLVAWREYSENAKTKGFWIGLWLFPAILFLSIQVPLWLEKKGTPTRYFSVADQSGAFAEVAESAVERSHQTKVLEALNGYALKNARPVAADADPLSEFREVNPRTVERFISRGGQTYFLEVLKTRLRHGAPPFKQPRRGFQQVPVPPEIDLQGDLAAIADKLKPYLRGSKKLEWKGQSTVLSAAILIPRTIDNEIVRPGTPRSPASGGIQYWSVNASDSKLREEIERAINNEIRRREFVARGIDLAAVRQVEQTYAPFTSLNPKKEQGREAMDAVDSIKQWAPSAFVYVLWVAIFAIVQMLLNNTIEEKSNRTIEVLLSSVTPGELMMGKLFGIAGIGLTMVGAWMAALFGIVSWKSGGASEIAGHILVVLKSSNLVPMFSLYFLLGYLMYAAFILSVGSVCNTLKEAQSYMGVLTMIMMVPLMTMTFIPKDPNGVLARILSWIPLYTPFTMMNRAAADPPLFDLIGTLVLMLVTTAAALFMAGKIFRIGILRTGQPPRVIEMLRWLKRKEQ